MIVLLTALLVASLGGVALAGDNVALFYFDPNEVEADAGETVDIDVILQTHGGYHGEGIDTVAVGIDYDPDVLTASTIERGPFLEGSDGAGIDVDTNVDESDGVISIEQVRHPPGDGATGTDTVASVIFEVNEDTSPTNTTLTMTGVEAILIDGLPQATITRDATIVIEGGGETDESTADEEGEAGVTLAEDDDDRIDTDSESDDADRDVPTNASGEHDTENGASYGPGTDAIPGFGIIGTVAALAAWLILGYRRRSIARESTR